MKNKKKKKYEFSKSIIGLLVSTYFLVLILGLFVVLRILITYPEYSVQALIALFSYVGGVLAITLPFYLTTKRDENMHKFPDITNINDYKQMEEMNISENNSENTNTKG